MKNIWKVRNNQNLMNNNILHDALCKNVLFNYRIKINFYRVKINF